MVAAVESYLGKGAYRISDAARILHAPYNTVRSWLNEDHGLIRRQFRHDEQLVGFLELMELHFVKMFRDEGLSLQFIRKAATEAAKKFHTDYPFAVKRFDTDGKTIFATMEKNTDDEDLIEDLRHGQYVITKIVRPFFKKLSHDTSEISQYWPLGKRGKVVLDPKRQFGRPIDAASGIATRVLYNAVIAGKGQNMKRVADWYGVPVASVRAAVEFERSLLA